AAFWSLRPAVEAEELFGRAARVLVDLLGRKMELVAQQQPDLHVAHDETKEGTERFLGTVEAEEPRIAPGFEHRLQPPAHLQPPVLEHDGAEPALLPARVGDGETVERHGNLAGQRTEEV